MDTLTTYSWQLSFPQYFYKTCYWNIFRNLFGSPLPLPPSTHIHFFFFLLLKYLIHYFIYDISDKVFLSDAFAVINLQKTSCEAHCSSYKNLQFNISILMLKTFLVFYEKDLKVCVCLLGYKLFTITGFSAT